MNRIASALTTLFVLAAPCALQAWPTTLARMDLRELTTRATIVARARCVRVASWPAGNLVWTSTSFQLTESWKGDPPARFEVRLPGGEAGGRHVIVEGAPRFTVGEDAVLFLEPLAGGEMTIVSWAQGTFRVHANPRTHAEEATQDTVGMLLIGRSGNATSAAGAARDPAKCISLARLRALVAHALAGSTR